jgi:hypothetical protein
MEIATVISPIGGNVARKTVLVCDKCGSEVEEGKGAVMRVTFNDARRGAKAADLCESGAPAVPEPRPTVLRSVREKVLLAARA